MAVNLRAKIHPSTKNLGQILAVTKIFQTESAQSFRVKLRQDIDIAPLSIKVVPQNRARETQTADSTVLAKDRYLPWVNLYG